MNDIQGDGREDLELRDALRKLRAAEFAVGEARRSLDAVLAHRSTAPPPAAPPAPQSPSTPSATSGPLPYPAPPTPQSPYPPQPSQASAPLQGPPKPPVSTETKILRAIAIAGSLITVIGVGLVVALAIQHGWLGPLGRVLLSLLLAALLLVGGLWLHRRGDSPMGVNALVVTSYLITTVVVVALVHVLDWWGEGAGALALLATWLGFLLLARYHGFWVVALCMGIAWFLLGAYVSAAPSTWVLTLIPLTLLAATWGSDRASVRMAAAVIAILTPLRHTGWSVPVFNELITVLYLVSALAFAAVSLRDPRTGPAQFFLGVGAPVFLLLASVPTAHESHVLWLLLPVMVGLTALGYFHVDEPGADVRPVARLLEVVGVGSTAVALLFIWWLSPPMGAGERVDATIVVACFFLVAVAAFHWLDHRGDQIRFGPAPWLVWWGGAIIITWNLARSVLVQTPVWLTDNIALVQALLIAVFLGFAFRLRRRLTGFEPWVQVVFAVAALYLSMVAIVTATTWAGSLLGGNVGMWSGYLIGHAGVSVLWMVLAAWVLLAPDRLTDSASLWAGVLLAGAGTMKLVFFDLGTLEGLPRAVAFLLSGLALLAMASLRTRRARATGQSSSARN